eukprot:Hpha_TRINITY_DN9986_c1_g2::TRINITY_DN9986_c1_g2_i2::g.140576::m.140576
MAGHGSLQVVSMAPSARLVRFADKICIEAPDLGGSPLAVTYVGAHCIPVVERQERKSPAWGFERCVFQVEDVTKSADRLMGGEAAEEAKFVHYGQDVKLWNVFANRYLTAARQTTEEMRVPDKAPSLWRRAQPETRDCDMTRAMQQKGTIPNAGEYDLDRRQTWRVQPHESLGQNDLEGEKVVFDTAVTLVNQATHARLEVTGETTASLLVWKSCLEREMEEQGAKQPEQLFVQVARPREGTEAVNRAAPQWKFQAYETAQDLAGVPVVQLHHHAPMHVHGPPPPPLAGRDYIPAGSTVVLFHREQKGFLRCEVPKGEKAGVYLDKHFINKPTYSVEELPYSSNALWVIEGQDARKGGAVAFTGNGAPKPYKTYRLRHAATGLYVHAHKEQQYSQHDVAVTYKPNEASTYLNFLPVEGDLDPSHTVLTGTSFVRVRLEESGEFLAGSEDSSVDDPARAVVPGDQFQAPADNSGKLSRVETTTLQNDVFAIRCVAAEERETLRQVCTMVGTLQRFERYWEDVKKKRESPSRRQELEDGDQKRQQVAELQALLQGRAEDEVGAKLVRTVVDSLKALVLFCTGAGPEQDPFGHQGPAQRRRQEVLLQQGVHHVLFRVLRAPTDCADLSLKSILEEETQEAENLRTIYQLAYRLMRQMITGAKDLAAHLSPEPYLRYIESQLGAMTAVAEAYTEIIRDNDRLLRDLSAHQLESFLWLIPQFGRKAAYIKLLATCCTCDSRGMEANQDMLVEKLRAMEKLQLLFPLKVDPDDGCLMIRELDANFPESADRGLRRFRRRCAQAQPEDETSSGTETQSDPDDAPSPHSFQGQSPHGFPSEVANALEALKSPAPQPQVQVCELPPHTGEPRWSGVVN